MSRRSAFVAFIAISVSAFPAATIPAQAKPVPVKTAARNPPNAAPRQIIGAELACAAPGDGRPNPHFSPTGTQIALSSVAERETLPAGSMRPAKLGVLMVGSDKSSWIPALTTACSEREDERLVEFDQHGRTHRGIGANSRTQQYFVNFWSVREDSASAMDGDHNALSNKDDMWSVLAESTGRRMGQRAERGARAGKEHGPPRADRLRSDMVRSLPHDGSVGVE